MTTIKALTDAEMDELIIAAMEGWNGAPVPNAKEDLAKRPLTHAAWKRAIKKVLHAYEATP